MEQRPKCKELTVEYFIDPTEKQVLRDYTFQTNHGYVVTIKQNPHRTIDVSADEDVDIDELYSILTKLEKLLMMMDGRFHISPPFWSSKCETRCFHACWRRFTLP